MPTPSVDPLDSLIDSMQALKSAPGPVAVPDPLEALLNTMAEAKSAVAPQRDPYDDLRRAIASQAVSAAARPDLFAPDPKPEQFVTPGSRKDLGNGTYQYEVFTPPPGPEMRSALPNGVRPDFKPTLAQARELAPDIPRPPLPQGLKSIAQLQAEAPTKISGATGLPYKEMPFGTPIAEGGNFLDFPIVGAREAYDGVAKMAAPTEALGHDVNRANAAQSGLRFEGNPELTGKLLKQGASGASKVIGGTLHTAMPFMLPAAAMAAPAQTALGLAYATGTQVVTSAGMKEAGVSPEYAELAGDIAGLLVGGSAIKKVFRKIDQKIEIHNLVAENLMEQEARVGMGGTVISDIITGSTFPKTEAGRAVTEYLHANPNAVASDIAREFRIEEDGARMILEEIQKAKGLPIEGTDFRLESAGEASSATGMGKAQYRLVNTKTGKVMAAGDANAIKSAIAEHHRSAGDIISDLERDLIRDLDERGEGADFSPEERDAYLDAALDMRAAEAGLTIDSRRESSPGLRERVEGYLAQNRRYNEKTGVAKLPPAAEVARFFGITKREAASLVKEFSTRPGATSGGEALIEKYLTDNPNASEAEVAEQFGITPEEAAEVLAHFNRIQVGSTIKAPRATHTVVDLLPDGALMVESVTPTGTVQRRWPAELYQAAGGITPPAKVASDDELTPPVTQQPLTRVQQAAGDLMQESMGFNPFAPGTAPQQEPPQLIPDTKAFLKARASWLKQTKDAQHDWELESDKRAGAFMEANPGVTWEDAKAATADHAPAPQPGQEPRPEDFKTLAPPQKVEKVKEVKPNRTQTVTNETPNAPTAATGTKPESPATIAIQVQQLGVGLRRVVMFPKGPNGEVPANVPDMLPEHVARTSDDHGNLYAYRTDLTNPEDIKKASHSNKLTEILGHAQFGMGAPDKTMLQGDVVVVVVRDANGTEVQSAATDEAHVEQTTAALQALMPEGGSIGVETAEQAVGARTDIQAPAPIGGVPDAVAARDAQRLADATQAIEQAVASGKKITGQALQRQFQLGYGAAERLLQSFGLDVLGKAVPEQQAPELTSAGAKILDTIQSPEDEAEVDRLFGKAPAVAATVATPPPVPAPRPVGGEKPTISEDRAQAIIARVSAVMDEAVKAGVIGKENVSDAISMVLRDIPDDATDAEMDQVIALLRSEIAGAGDTVGIAAQPMPTTEPEVKPAAAQPNYAPEGITKAEAYVGRLLSPKKQYARAYLDHLTLDEAKPSAGKMSQAQISVIENQINGFLGKRLTKAAAPVAATATTTARPPLKGWIGAQSPERQTAIREVMRDIFDEGERARQTHQDEVKAMGNRLPVGGAHMDSLFRAEAINGFSGAVWDGKNLQQAVDAGVERSNEAIKKWNQRSKDYAIARGLGQERSHLEDLASRVARAGEASAPAQSDVGDGSEPGGSTMTRSSNAKISNIAKNYGIDAAPYLAEVTGPGGVKTGRNKLERAIMNAHDKQQQSSRASSWEGRQAPDWWGVAFGTDSITEPWETVRDAYVKRVKDGTDGQTMMDYAGDWAAGKAEAGADRRAAEATAATKVGAPTTQVGALSDLDKSLLEYLGKTKTSEDLLYFEGVGEGEQGLKDMNNAIASLIKRGFIDREYSTDGGDIKFWRTPEGTKALREKKPVTPQIKTGVAGSTPMGVKADATLTPDQIEAITLISTATRNRFTTYDLAGDSNSKLRARLMSLLTGKNIPVASAGVNALRSKLYEIAGIAENTEAGREAAFGEWAKALLAEKTEAASDSPEKTASQIMEADTLLRTAKEKIDELIEQAATTLRNQGENNAREVLGQLSAFLPAAREHVAKLASSADGGYVDRLESAIARAEAVIGRYARKPAARAAQPSAERYDQLSKELAAIEKSPEYRQDTEAGRNARESANSLSVDIAFHRPAAIAKAQAEIDAEKEAKVVNKAWKYELKAEGKWSQPLGSPLATEAEAKAAGQSHLARWYTATDVRTAEVDEKPMHTWNEAYNRQEPIQKEVANAESSSVTALPPVNESTPIEDVEADAFPPVLADAPAGEPGHIKLANAALRVLQNGGSFGNNVEFQKMADEAFGGSRANGKYDMKQAYDALEAAVNRYIADSIGPDLMSADPKYALQQLRDLMKRLPTQNVRTENQELLQQFSTPPTLAYFAAKVADIRLSDIALEPSAGNGGIAAFVKAAGAIVRVNEIDKRRAELLAYAIRGSEPTNFDAEFLNATLPSDIRPTVVVMNPPFSSTGGRLSANKNTFGYKHVMEALRRLQPGGRLVAILGEGATPTAPNAKGFWADIAKYGVLRANVGIDGKEYAKYGTTFGNRLIVIDKLSAVDLIEQVGEPIETVFGQYKTIEEAYDAIEPVIRQRPASQAVVRSGGPVRGATGSESGISGERGGGTGTSVTGNAAAGSSSGRSGSSSRPIQGQKPGTVTEDITSPEISSGSTGDSGGSAVEPLRPEDRVALESRKKEDLLNRTEDDGSFVEYVPSIDGLAHPGRLVETKVMASVNPPPVTYRPNLPNNIKAPKPLSAAQMEAVARAGMMHQTFDESGNRLGFLMGDGCVAAGTKIYDPTSDTHTPIEELVLRGSSHYVLSLTRDGFMPTQAHCPFLKGTANLYRVILDDDRSITVTNEHKFLTPHGWMTIGQGLLQGDWLACAEIAQSIHCEVDLGAPDESEQNCSGRPEDYLDRYSLSRRSSCDEQPQNGEDSDQVPSPSPAGAREHIHDCQHADGRSPSPGRSRHHPGSDPLSKSSSSQVANHVRALISTECSAGISQEQGVKYQAPELSDAVTVSPLPQEHGLYLHQSLSPSNDCTHRGSAGTRLTDLHTQKQFEESPRISSREPSRIHHENNCQSPQHRPLLPGSKSSAYLNYGRWHRIVSMEFIGVNSYYDMWVPGTENYLAEGIVNHNTGVGKGQQIAAIIWDRYRSGQRRAIWVSASKGLQKAAKGDFIGIGAKEMSEKLHSLNDWNAAQKLDLEDGVIFLTYQSLVAKAKGETGQTRLDQIKEWLGEDGVIIFDESQKGKNAVAGSGRAVSSKTGENVVKLQDELPKAYVVYVSATAATDVNNLGYMVRMGLWGKGTPFHQGFGHFMTEVGRGGIAAMELIAREMKAVGKYLSRSISLKGVTFEERVHELTTEQRATYDAAVKAWQMVLNSGLQQIRDNEADGSRALGEFTQAYWGTHQRFFRKLLTAMKVPSVLEMVDKALKENKSVVISLIGTGQAQADQAMASGAAEDEDDLDFSPKDSLIKMVKDSYPTVLYEEFEKEDGGIGKRPVIRLNPATDKFEIQHNPEAIARRDEIVAELDRELALPDNPLDFIIRNYGRDQVAELTGRKKSVERNKESGKWENVSRAPEGVPMDKINEYEMEQFQNGQKRIAIISKASGAGFSLHADLAAKNQQPRLQIVIELSWSADDQIQSFGRTHRSNQKQPPEYVIMSTDAGGEKRFSSTIARRLESLGALTKGQRDASGGSSVLAKYNFETLQGQQAAQAFYTYLLNENPTIQGTNYTGHELLTQMGILQQPTDDAGNPTGPPTIARENMTNVTRLMNRVMNIELGAKPSSHQNAAFDLFTSLFDQSVQRAIEDGTLDTGVNLVRGDHVRLIAAKPIAKDPASGAETLRYILEAERKNKPVDDDVVRSLHDKGRGRMMKARTGVEHDIVWVERSRTPVTNKNGTVENAYNILRPGHRESGTSYERMPESELSDKYEWLAGARVLGEIKRLDESIPDMEKSVKEQEARKARGGYSYVDWHAGELQKQKTRKAELMNQVRKAQEGQFDLWVKAYDAAPKSRVERIDMIGGSVMRVWPLLKVGNGKMDIRIAYPDSGGSVTGVAMAEGDANAVEQSLTGNRVVRGPSSVFDNALSGKEAFNLMGGVKLAQGRINRQPVIEVSTTDYNNQRFLDEAGVKKEKIGWQYKYYIPNDAAVGVPIVEKLLKQFPLVEKERPSQGSTSVTLGMGPGQQMYEASTEWAAGYAKEEILPGVQALLSSSKEFGIAAKMFLYPVGSVPNTKEMRLMDSISRWQGGMETAKYLVAQKLDTWRDRFSRMPEREQIEFVNRVKRGEAQPDQELQDVADFIRKQDDLLYAALKEILGDDVPEYLFDHYRILWKVIPDSLKAIAAREARAQAHIDAITDSDVKTYLQEYLNHLTGSQPAPGRPKAIQPAVAKRLEQRIDKILESKAGKPGFRGQRNNMQGTKGWHRQHTLETMSEGIEHGGIPYSFNPLVNFAAHYEDVMKFIAAQHLFKKWKEMGAAVFVKAGAEGPESHRPINDYITKVHFKVPQGTVEAGEWWIHKGAANVIDNDLGRDYFRKSYADKPWSYVTGPLGRKLLDIKTITTSIELSLSMFHAGFESLEASAGMFALGLRRVINLGLNPGASKLLGLKTGVDSPKPLAEIKRGLQEMLGSPVAWVSMAQMGAQARRGWTEHVMGETVGATTHGLSYPLHIALKAVSSQLEGKLDSALAARKVVREMEKTVAGRKWIAENQDAAEMLPYYFIGGGKLGIPEDYQIHAQSAFMDALKRMTGDVATGNQKVTAGMKAMWHSLGSINEQMMKPLFDTYIPNLKIAAFLLEFALARREYAGRLMSGEMTEEQLARRVVSSVENRFGEMNFRRLFWNKTFKTGLQINIRSVTWKIGELLEGMMAIVGQGQEIARAIKYKELPLLYGSFAWALGVLAIATALGLFIRFVTTGKAPKNFHDTMYPIINEETGSRSAVNTYGTNYMHLIHDPAGYVRSSAAGWTGKLWELLVENMDFQGNQIREEDDTWGNVKRSVEHQVPMPFGPRQVYKDIKAGRVREAVVGFTGLAKKAPAYIDKSPALLLASGYMAKHAPRGGRNDMQAQNSEIARSIRNAYRNKQDKRAEEIISRATASGLITASDANRYKNKGATSPLVGMMKPLTPAESLLVYARATPEERAEIKQLVESKVKAIRWRTPGKYLEMSQRARDLAKEHFKIDPPAPLPAYEQIQ